VIAIIIKVSGGSSFIFSLIFTIFMGGSMTLVLEMVNTIQILVYMPLMDLRLP
jgi:hypothetical protein